MDAPREADSEHIEEHRPGGLTHIPFLDAARGFAVLSVFLYHSLGAAYGWENIRTWRGLFYEFDQPISLLALSPVTHGGSLGVATFFVISGFCIHLSHSKAREKSWTAFFWRRFFRIYPAYLLCLALFFFLWPWSHHSLEKAGDGINLISHIFAFHNFVYNAKFAINPSFWSIASEAQLYLAYPLLIWITAQLGWRRSLMILFALEVTIRLLDHHLLAASSPHYLISNSPLAFWFSWAIGAYLAESHLKGRKNTLGFLSMPLVVTLSVGLSQFRPTASLEFSIFALLAALVIDKMLAKPWRNPERGSPGWKAWQHLSLLGAVSYSFYLIHQPIVDAIKASFLGNLWATTPESGPRVAICSK